MSQDACEVVKIVRKECPGGFCEINKEDYNPKEHTLYKEKGSKGDK